LVSFYGGWSIGGSFDSSLVFGNKVEGSLFDESEMKRKKKCEHEQRIFCMRGKSNPVILSQFQNLKVVVRMRRPNFSSQRAYTFAGSSANF
jgi:hypothetical protein